ncbi:MAG: hypothetical protein KIT14_13995 [bacterium]|nr:hypothetical protein [bacterium]MCW5891644.1 hypothetical protein [bacterium]
MGALVIDLRIASGTPEELAAIVDRFERLRGVIQPPLTVPGAIIDQPDGQPALGWVSALRRLGDTLVATITGAPRLVADVLRAGAYEAVRAGFYPHWEETTAETNVQSGVRGKVLAGVTLVGAALPTAATLDDLARILAARELRTVPLGGLTFTDYRPKEDDMPLRFDAEAAQRALDGYAEQIMDKHHWPRSSSACWRRAFAVALHEHPELDVRLAEEVQLREAVRVICRENGLNASDPKDRAQALGMLNELAEYEALMPASLLAEKRARRKRREGPPGTVQTRYSERAPVVPPEVRDLVQRFADELGVTWDDRAGRECIVRCIERQYPERATALPPELRRPDPRGYSVGLAPRLPGGGATGVPRMMG